ncbi:hypothetical protein SORBI_3010G153201 [Sorghum bicolor]|uniref:Secreted protein n=1 Tax=Sorghum bicolor TaxID=4558 RepID=A0A1W0VTA2_SORBI|nr:hypothetical protein SORBI_3010G153201 [Sorghum bicolor]
MALSLLTALSLAIGAPLVKVRELGLCSARPDAQARQALVPSHGTTTVAWPRGRPWRHLACPTALAAPASTPATGLAAGMSQVSRHVASVHGLTHGSRRQTHQWRSSLGGGALPRRCARPPMVLLPW